MVAKIMQKYWWVDTTHQVVDGYHPLSAIFFTKYPFIIIFILKKLLQSNVTKIITFE